MTLYRYRMLTGNQTKSESLGQFNLSGGPCKEVKRGDDSMQQKSGRLCEDRLDGIASRQGTKLQPSDVGEAQEGSCLTACSGFSLVCLPSHWLSDTLRYYLLMLKALSLCCGSLEGTGSTDEDIRLQTMAGEDWGRGTLRGGSPGLLHRVQSWK